MQADADGDQERQLAGRRPRGEPASRRRPLGDRHRRAERRPGPLGGVRRRGAVTDRPGPAVHPSLVRHEGEQPGAETRGEQHPVPEGAAQPAVAGVEVAQRPVDRLPRRREHVPDEEQQDADRDRVQHHPQLRSRPFEPPDGQTQEDRHPGDEAEEERLGQAHAHLPLYLGEPNYTSNSGSRNRERIPDGGTLAGRAPSGGAQAVAEADEITGPGDVADRPDRLGFAHADRPGEVVEDLLLGVVRGQEAFDHGAQICPHAHLIDTPAGPDE